MTTNRQQIVDRTLPQLGSALNPAAMREVFAGVLFPSKELQSRYQVQDCEILQARYKPGKNCLLSFRLSIHDEPTMQQCEQILCARFYEPGGSLARFLKAQAQPLAATQFGPPMFHLPNLEMIGWVFPNDRKLMGLPRLTNAECLTREILPPVIAEAFGNGWKLGALREEIVHYVAEHTCTVRVTVDLQNATTGQARTAALYGKTYYNEDGAETFTRMRELMKSEACRQGRLVLAQPLAYQPEIRTLWQKGLPGAPLYEQATDSHLFIKMLKHSAVALAALHQSPISCQRKIGTADLLTRFDEVERMVALARPESLPKLHSLIERLKRQSQQIGERPAVTLHGDLHLKNFFVVGQEIALIDLDNLCLGDPLLELGSFVASLHYRNLLLKKQAQRVRELVDAFVRTYTESVPWAVTDSILNWYIAAALIAERAFRCVTRLKAERLTTLDEIIALADEISVRKQFVTAPSFTVMF
ncbi:MAG: phosphotransferase family protein [Blastocatellales bacterium]